MQVFYQGVDITKMVQVAKCICRDTSGDRCDSLDIVFENAAGWYSWGPKEDDQIIVSQDGYDTGIMYVNTILPEDGQFRIYATSLPCAARAKGYRSFTNRTAEDILRLCAAGSGMGYQLFGVEKNVVIPYLQRENESYAAFLCRWLEMEGAVLKCVDGKYTAIGIAYAQTQAARQTITVKPDQAGMEYRRNGRTYRTLRIVTPFASAGAEDIGVPGNHGGIILNYPPARNAIQAARWSRGLLLHTNRRSERLTMTTDLNVGYTAMTRIDIDGSGDAVGSWLIDDVTHDFINRRSTPRMHRCIDTIQ